MSSECDENNLKRHQQTLFTMLCEFDRVCTALNLSYVLFAGTMLGAVRHEGFIPWDDDLDIIMLRKDYDVFLQNAEKFLDTDRFFLQKEFSEHWPMFFSKLRLNGTACLEKYHPKDENTHQGVYIDLFPCDNAAASEWGRKIQFLSSKVVIAKSLYKRGYETDSKIKRIMLALCRVLPMRPFLAIAKGPVKETKMVHSFLGGSSKYVKSIYPKSYFAEHVMKNFEGRSFPVSKEYDKLLTQLYGDYMRIPSIEERSIKKHAILVDLDQSYEVYKDYRKDMIFDTYTRSIR